MHEEQHKEKNFVKQISQTILSVVDEHLRLCVWTIVLFENVYNFGVLNICET